jgi:hypothetical protein
MIAIAVTFASISGQIVCSCCPCRIRLRSFSS